VNTAIYSPSGTSAGVGFAIPVDVVNLVVPEIIRKGKFEPATLGIIIIDGDNERLKRFTGVDGVAIFDLVEDGPADRAGLRPFLRTSRGMREGDIILKIDDQETSTVRELQDALLNYRPGDKVTITFSREDKLYEAELELE
jgi:S1-C subfamily serine protease